MDGTRGPSGHNLRRLGRLELPGGGQVVVKGHHAFVGHIAPPHGTSIVDIADPRRPRLVGEVRLPDLFSHSHKVRVVGDLMIVNTERYRRSFYARGDGIPAAEAAFASGHGRPPTDAELAPVLGVKADEVAALRAARARGYTEGGFRIYDIADPTRPRQIANQRTGGIGVHRFDVDDRYAYISTEMAGFVGNILVIYDLADPARPAEVSRWWLPGQKAGDEAPHPLGAEYRLHHALRVGDELWAACWMGGVRAIDVTDIARPRTIGAFDTHPPFRRPTHTALKLAQPIGGRDIAVVADEELDDRKPGRPSAFLWVLDVTNRTAMRPLAVYAPGESCSPWAGMGARFGCHQFAERVVGNRLFVTWFSGGVRVVDLADPTDPTEIAWFIPEAGAGGTAPQSNDVVLDDRGLVIVTDRISGLDILELAV